MIDRNNPENYEEQNTLVFNSSDLPPNSKNEQTIFQIGRNFRTMYHCQIPSYVCREENMIVTRLPNEGVARAFQNAALREGISSYLSTAANYIERFESDEQKQRHRSLSDKFLKVNF